MGWNHQPVYSFSFFAIFFLGGPHDLVFPEPNADESTFSRRLGIHPNGGDFVREWDPPQNAISSGFGDYTMVI